MSFQNPSGYWERDGVFTIELFPGAPELVVPGFTREGDVVTMDQPGWVKQDIGGINFHVRHEVFRAGYKWLACIRDAEGNLVWKSRRYPKDE